MTERHPGPSRRVSRRSPSPVVVLAAWLATVGLVGAEVGPAPAGVSDAAADIRVSEIRASIFENLPAEDDKARAAGKVSPTWDEPAEDAAPTTVWSLPAFGMFRVPSKYNARGIEIDRSWPFAVRIETSVRFAPGEHRLALRSLNPARLRIDGELVAEIKPRPPHKDDAAPVPTLEPPIDPRWRYARLNDQERIVAITIPGDDADRERSVELWVLVGRDKLRPELSELSLSRVESDGLAAPLAPAGSPRVVLTDDGWRSFEDAENARLDAIDDRARRLAAASESEYWNARHARARAFVGPRPPGFDPTASVDAAHARAAERRGVPLEPELDRAAFLRRLSLDTIGVIPAPEEVEAILADPRPDAEVREAWIETRLADPRWADALIPEWQDALAENPGILKPTLNNTGPFRRFLRDAFRDNLPFDRFVTELARMDGSTYLGGPAAFGVASQNDAPMVAKAHILAKTFLAADMTCARCHDAPLHPFDQSDLFGLAGFLLQQPQVVPRTSTVPLEPGGRIPAVSITLKAGEAVPPGWGETLAEATETTNDRGADPASWLPPGVDAADPANGRLVLAALMTNPANPRFARVAVNRLWNHFLGHGLVEPLDDWDREPKRRDDALLDALADELARESYDLKAVARIILRTRAYRSRPAPLPEDPSELPIAPPRRRLSAEALVDSMFAAAGKRFEVEELTLDPECSRPRNDLPNLGKPRRAWEFVSPASERDRPALALPAAQSVVDVLETFGWRVARPDPMAVRDSDSTARHAGALANGIVVHGRIARLCDAHAVTELALRDQPLENLIRQIHIRFLGRPASADEIEDARALLDENGLYDRRIVPGAGPAPRRPDLPRRVTWSNHLNPDATLVMLEEQKRVEAGDTPTPRLDPEFRERLEDWVWTLVNSPDFVFVP